MLTLVVIELIIVMQQRLRRSLYARDGRPQLMRRIGKEGTGAFLGLLRASLSTLELIQHFVEGLRSLAYLGVGSSGRQPRASVALAHGLGQGRHRIEWPQGESNGGGNEHSAEQQRDHVGDQKDPAQRTPGVGDQRGVDRKRKLCTVNSRSRRVERNGGRLDTRATWNAASELCPISQHEIGLYATGLHSVHELLRTGTGAGELSRQLRLTAEQSIQVPIRLGYEDRADRNAEQNQDHGQDSHDRCNDAEPQRDRIEPDRMWFDPAVVPSR